MSNKRVLIIEDDPNLVELLNIHCTDNHYEVEKALDGELGLQKALTNTFDLIVLDLMLPKMDGLTVCRSIRSNGLHTPILMLTAKTEEIDKIIGLEMGADDYMTKPFSVREFLARVKAILRRQSMLNEERTVVKQDATLKFGALTIDLDKRRVALSDKRIELSPKEFDLLSLLASNPGKSYNRSNILNLVWGYDFEGYEHTVNSHINRLRSKIEPDISKPLYILTTWGIGYRFNEDLVD